MAAADDVFSGNQYCVVFSYMMSWVGSWIDFFSENVPTFSMIRYIVNAHDKEKSQG